MYLYTYILRIHLHWNALSRVLFVIKRRRIEFLFSVKRCNRFSCYFTSIFLSCLHCGRSAKLFRLRIFIPFRFEGIPYHLVCIQEASRKIVCIVTYRVFPNHLSEYCAPLFDYRANISFRSVITVERRGKNAHPWILMIYFPTRGAPAPTDTRVNSAAIYILLGTTRTAYSDLTNVECPAYRK